MADGAIASILVTWTERPLDITPAVRRLVVEDHDRLIDEARITLDDHASIAGANFEPGQGIEVSIGWEQELQKIFVGKIKRVEGRSGEGGHATLVVHDPSAAMHSDPGGRVFPPGTKLSEIVRLVADDYREHFPVEEIECDPDTTFVAPNVPHLAGRTDFEFLQDLASVWGARCFVEVNGDGPKFYFKSIRSLWSADPLARLVHCHGWGDVIDFRYERVAARAARQLVASTSDPRTGEVVTGDSGPPPAAPQATGGLRPDVAQAEPQMAQVHQTATEAGAGASLPARTLSLLGLPSDPERARALVVIDPTQVSGYRAEARVVGHHGLRAKGRVEVDGIAPWAEGSWWVKRATHQWTRSDGARREPSTTWETNLELTR